MIHREQQNLWPYFQLEMRLEVLLLSNRRLLKNRRGGPGDKTKGSAALA